MTMVARASLPTRARRRGAIVSATSFVDIMTLGGLTAFWDSRTTMSAASWTDRKGGFVLAQATSGNQPAYSASDSNFGGKPSLTFDGVDDFMESATPISSIISASAFTALCVVQAVSAGNNANSYFDPAILSDGAAELWAIAFVNPTGTSFTYKIYDWDGTGDKHDDLALADSVYALAFKLDGGKLYSRNGSAGAWSTGTSSGNVSGLTGTLTMGRDGSTVNYGGLKIAALATFNTALSDADATAALRSLEHTFT